jgi:hypothetical protein
MPLSFLIELKNLGIGISEVLNGIADSQQEPKALKR